MNSANQQYSSIAEDIQAMEELHSRCEKEKEEITQYYKTQMEDLKKTFTDLTSAAK